MDFVTPLFTYNHILAHHPSNRHKKNHMYIIILPRVTMSFVAKSIVYRVQAGHAQITTPYVGKPSLIVLWFILSVHSMSCQFRWNSKFHYYHMFVIKGSDSTPKEIVQQMLQKVENLDNVKYTIFRACGSLIKI